MAFAIGLLTVNLVVHVLALLHDLKVGAKVAWPRAFITVMILIMLAVVVSL